MTDFFDPTPVPQTASAPAPTRSPFDVAPAPAPVGLVALGGQGQAPPAFFAPPQGQGVAGRVTGFLDQTRGMAGAPLGAFASALPAALTDPLSAATGIGGTRAPRVDPAYQRNMTALTNKYTEMSATIAALPESIRNALIDMDSQRVAAGSPPLTRDQTTAAIQTATTNQAATPTPERNPLSVWDNFRSDASDILKSIPRLPLAMFNEVRDLPKFSEKIAEARAAGASPIAALAQAPGVRMIPGSYIVGGLAGGGQGIRDLLTHPLMTGLDALPMAHAAAGSTKVGKLAAEASELAGRRARPISAVLTNKLGTAADGTATLERNAVGHAIDYARTETRPGQMLDSFGGRVNRDVMRILGAKQSRYQALLSGKGVGDDVLESFLPRITNTFERHAKTTPLLAEQSTAAEAWRAQLKADFERGQNLDQYDPGLISDYRALVDDIGNHAVQNDILARYQDELYPTDIARDLRSREARVRSTELQIRARDEYKAPSGKLGPDDMRSMMDEALGLDTTRLRGQGARAVLNVLDAYGYDTAPLKTAITGATRARGDLAVTAWRDVRGALDDTLAATMDGAPQPRRSYTEIVDALRAVRDDRQVTLLEAALTNPKRSAATNALRNLMERKPPAFPEAEWPRFREDVASLSRRMDFDAKVGARNSEARLAQRASTLERGIAANPPARFDALLGDEVVARAGEVAKSKAATRYQTLGRDMTADEAAGIVAAVQERRWGAAFPDMTPDEVQATMRGIEADVKATWTDLRAKGADPIFVHRVSPGRANAAATGSIGPVPIKASQGAERALDLTPGVNDIQVSLTHQAGELLAERYREQFADEMIQSVGRTEAALRDELADTVRWRMEMDPSLDFEGHLQQAIKRGYEKFNPDTAGSSWGGVKLDKYRQDAVYIPKSVAENLHRIAKPPSLISAAMDPFTKMFRYNVIGLSAGVIVNNFFSNSVATLAEVGPGPFKYWSEAKKWIDDPASITNKDMQAMILAETPALESMNRDAWLKSRAGQRFMISKNAGAAFRDSAIAEGLKKGKNALDSVAEKSMQFQQLGDNIYRGMIYMDQLDKGLAKGASREAAEAAAVEQVRRVLVDYNSFTPLERSAVRTVIPFYSYMGHAMRFVGRYPLDHPLRASITAKLAAAEKERLGSLPGSFLGMIPIGKPDSHGNQTMLPLAPFDPFGDISDMFSVAGWLSATNPVISSALETAGLTRGVADAYPNLRYDPETGRLKPVSGSFFGNLFNNTIPRAGLVTAALGMNDQYNDLRGKDPAAAGRSLMSAAGLPRLWRETNLPQEQFKAEVQRQKSATTVKNEAMKSGDWSEALRYPSLQGYFDQISSATPDQLGAYTPAERGAIAEQLRILVGSS